MSTKILLTIILEIITTSALAYALYKNYRLDPSDTQLQKIEQQMAHWPVNPKKRSAILFIISGLLFVVSFGLILITSYTFINGLILAVALITAGMGFYFFYLGQVQIKYGAKGMTKVITLLKKNIIILIATLMAVNFITRELNPYLMTSLGFISSLLFALPAYLVAHEQ